MSYQTNELLRDSKMLCHRLKRQRTTTATSKSSGDNLLAPSALKLLWHVKIVYEKLLLLDEQFAVLHDVPMLLWKTCFYRQIEEYREAIKRHVQASFHLTQQQRDSEEGLTVSQGLKQASTEFIAYLDNAKSYFLQLLCKLQNKDGYDPQSITVQQFHIYLGDISRYRYREVHSEQSLKDWKEAKAHYDTAQHALPDRGNSYNQLAVLATYIDEECVAAYNYCRALLCKFPFLTARDNFMLLFQKNKQLIAQQEKQQVYAATGNILPGDLIPSSSAGTGLSLGSGPKGGSVGNSNGRRRMALLVKTFLRRFVHVQGVILCAAQDAATEFNSLLDVITKDFNTLLKHSAFGDTIILRMIALCISTVEMTSTMCEVWKGSFSSLIPNQHIEIRRCALTLAFAVAAEVGQHVRTCDPVTSDQQEQQHQNSSNFFDKGGLTSAKSPNVPISSSTTILLTSCEVIGKCSRSHRPFNGGNCNRKGGGEGSRNSGVSGTPREPGSRLLGPLVLFCSWLSSRPECLIAAASTAMPNSSNSSLASSDISTVIEEKEKSTRMRFWKVICSLANALPSPPTSWVSTGVWKTLVLKEHYELRGFSPLDEVIEDRLNFLGDHVGRAEGGGRLCGQVYSDKNGSEGGREKNLSAYGRTKALETCDNKTAAMARVHMLKLFADSMTTYRALSSSPLLVRDTAMGSFYVAKTQHSTCTTLPP